MIRKLRVKTVRFIRKNKEVFFINIIIKIYFGILKLLPKNIYFRILTFYKCKRKLEYIKLKFFRRKTEEIILKVDKTKLYFPDVGNAFMFINEQETFDIYKELNNLNCVLDLGANVGDSAYYLAKRNKQVICYEASPKLFSYLKKNSLKREKLKIFNNYVKTNENQISKKRIRIYL